MIIEDIKQINIILEKMWKKRIAIVTHENPDGDGLATAIAFTYFLREYCGAKPFIIMDSEFPTFLDFLLFKSCRIFSYQSYIEKFKRNFDYLIVLDCHEKERVDCNRKIFDISEKVLVIDHHITRKSSLNPELDYYIDPTAVCTGVMIHRFLYEKIMSFQKDFPDNNLRWIKIYADCIYTSIINDTDNFVNSNTDQETFSVVADLIGLGLKPHKIANKFLYQKSISYFKFLGKVLTTIEVEKSIAMYHSTLAMLAESNQTTDAYSKMMRWTKGVNDIDIIVFFQEYENNLWRIGLRSEKYNVAKIAHHFAGGGHERASGFQIKGDFETIKQEVISYLKSFIG